MSFFGIDRQGPPAQLWVNEREVADLRGTHRAPTRLAGLQAAEGTVLYGPRGEVVANTLPRVVGLSAWLPETEAIDSDREICDDCGHTLLNCICGQLDD